MSKSPIARNHTIASADGIRNSRWAEGIPQHPLFDWQLPEGYYEPRKSDAIVVIPRASVNGSQSELSARSAYLWAHEEVPYVRRVGAMYGAWPFKWELVEAPAGATIVDVLPYNEETNTYDWDQSYGKLQWTPPAGSNGQSFRFIVSLKDQEYARGVNPSEELFIEWEVTVQNSQWIFVSADTTEDGDGTIASPRRWNEYNTEWANNTFPSDYVDKFAMFRGGVYPANAPRNIGGGTRPNAVIGYPGENVIFEKIAFRRGNPDDMYASSFTIDGSVDNQQHCYGFALFGGNRMAVHDITFENLVNTTGVNSDILEAGQANPSGIFLTGATPFTRNYFSIIGCNFKGFTRVPRNFYFDPPGTGTESNWTFYNIYRSFYMLIELNAAEDSLTTRGFFLKGTSGGQSPSRYVTIRANRCFKGMSGIGMTIWNGSDQESQDVNAGDLDICYNKIFRFENVNGTRASGQGIMPNENWYTRNTFFVFETSNFHRVNEIWQLTGTATTNNIPLGNNWRYNNPSTRRPPLNIKFNSTDFDDSLSILSLDRRRGRTGSDMTKNKRNAS